MSASGAAGLRGVRLFNRGRYLAAQAVWETAWRAAHARQLPLRAGLAQPPSAAHLRTPRAPQHAARATCAPALHLRTGRGATRGADHLVAQALATLEDFRPAAAGLDVEALLAEFAAFLDWLREVRRPHRLTDRLRIPRLRTV